MKINFLIAFLLYVGLVQAQRTPTLLIDGTPIKFQSDLSLPYWVNAGKSIALSLDAVSVSILEFNVVNNELQFNQAIHLTASSTVPTGKVWKIEAIGLGTNSSDLPINGFSNAAMPSIFTSPVTFTGASTWKVPPGITSICIEAWGKGGSGGNGVYVSTGSKNGGPGGGGAYGYDCITVNPGDELMITIDQTGTTVSNVATSQNLIFAGAGTNGTSATSTNDGIPGIGGTSTASFSISGGNGGSPGGHGGNGGNGGAGGAGQEYNSAAVAGSFPGGGGGAGRGAYSGPNGKAGGNGQVIIYF